jgi:hypothetical protein
MVINLINIQYPRLMAISGLLLCMIVLWTINSVNTVFAQNSNPITPDFKTFFSDAIFPDSDSSADFGNVDDRTHSPKVGRDAQVPTNAEDETTTAPEVDETTTAPEVDESTTAPEVDESTTAPEVDETTSATEEKMQEAEKRANDALFESAIFGLDISFD